MLLWVSPENSLAQLSGCQGTQQNPKVEGSLERSLEMATVITPKLHQVMVSIRFKSSFSSLQSYCPEIPGFCPCEHPHLAPDDGLTQGVIQS